MIENWVKKNIISITGRFNKLEGKDSFNVKSLDRRISCLARLIYWMDKSRFHPYSRTETKGEKIGFISSFHSDMGGHTECLISIILALKNRYDINVFSTRLNMSEYHAPIKHETIKAMARCSGGNCSWLPEDLKEGEFRSCLIDLYNMIVDSRINILFVFLHRNDVLGVCVLALLKKITGIKIVFFNHASHLPALGMSYSDLIIEGTSLTHYVTKKYRKMNKGVVMGLPSKPKSSTTYYGKKKIEEVRHSFGVMPGEFLTMTGCTAYKLIENGASPYFEMIKKLLSREKLLKHVFINGGGDLSIIESIFADAPDERKRLIIADSQADFDLLFQSCDVFIDSFPMNSATTLIDLMRNKKSVVVKINEDNILYSFHEYLPENYPYAYRDIEELEQGIIDLLHDARQREKIEGVLYQFYLNTYESECIMKKYSALVEGSEHLKDFYDPAPKTTLYKC